MDPVTPADLAELLESTAAAVLAEHGLDCRRAAGDGHRRAAAQPRARRLRHQPGPAGGQEGRRNPARARPAAGRPARRADGIARADVAGPGFVNMRLEAAARASVAASDRRRGRGLRPREPLAGRRINLEFVSANPTGPIHIGGTRWAAVGDALAPGAQRPGAEVGAGVLLQRPRRPDRPVRQLADRRRQGPARPEDGYAAPTSTTSPREVVAKRPDAIAGLPTTSSARRSARSAYACMFRPHQETPRALRHRLRRLYSRRLAARVRRGSTRPSPSCASTATSTRRTARTGCAPPTSATTRTAWSSRATASRPTSPATSPTTSTSASAASTCASTCSAPTTTATSPGCKAVAAAPVTTPTTTSRC